MPDNEKTKTKELDEQTIKKEMEEFIKSKGYSAKDINSNVSKFANDFLKYLEDRGYDYKNLPDVNINFEQEHVDTPKKRKKRITKISEELNEQENLDFTVFLNTTEMTPGLVCYVVESIAPTDKVPYVTYKPAPRIITQIHDSGVNQGTLFFSYSHRIVYSTITKIPQVISEEEVIYSPLTKSHAEYICKLLNIQSKQTYMNCIKQISMANNKQIIK